MVTHTKDRCVGTACPIHHPSDHHMKAWPVTLRAFGLAERQCDHGVGHPDPDSITYLKKIAPDIPFDGHGCDGCCEPEPAQKELLA